MNKLKLNSNQLKMIGAVTMFIDHLGYLIFPNVIILRIIGRLSFPIFSYFIYVGAKYTRDINKYFFKMLVAGLLMMIPTYFVGGVIWGNIMVTFSCSIALIILIKRYNASESFVDLALLIAYITFLFILNSYITIDYGLVGIALPALAYIFDDGEQKGTVNYASMAAFSIGLLVLAFGFWTVQFYSLISILFLLMYDGTIGELNLKNFFYWFYPVHYVLLLGISKLL